MNKQIDFVKSDMNAAENAVFDDLMYTLYNISFTKSTYCIFRDILIKSTTNDSDKNVIIEDIRNYFTIFYENLSIQMTNSSQCLPFFGNLMNKNIEPFVLRKIQVIIQNHKSNLKNKDVCVYVLQIVSFIIFLREYLEASKDHLVFTEVTKEYSRISIQQEIYARGPFPLLHPFGPGYDNSLMNILALANLGSDVSCLKIRPVTIPTEDPMQTIFHMYGNAMKICSQFDELNQAFQTVFFRFFKLYRVFVLSTNPNIQILDFKTFSVLFERIVGSCLQIKEPFRTYVPCVQTRVIRLTLSAVQSLDIAEYIDTEYLCDLDFD